MFCVAIGEFQVLSKCAASGRSPNSTALCSMNEVAAAADPDDAIVALAAPGPAYLVGDPGEDPFALRARRIAPVEIVMHVAIAAHAVVVEADRGHGLVINAAGADLQVSHAKKLARCGRVK